MFYFFVLFLLPLLRFEVVETLRRLLLTGGLLFLNPGTAAQIMGSMVMCLGAMRIYAGYKPFIEDSNDLLAETAQWQLFFTMFAALAIRVNADQEGLQDRAFFDAMLCVVQFVGVGVGFITFLTCKEDLAAVKEEIENVRKMVSNDELEATQPTLPGTFDQQSTTTTAPNPPTSTPPGLPGATHLATLPGTFGQQTATTTAPSSPTSTLPASRA